MADYIINISKDMAGLKLEFIYDYSIEPAKDFENTVSNENACSVEDDVIDIHRSKRCAESQGDHKLGKFKDKPNSNCQPYDIS
jgi:hypothetical protein